jgi:Zn-dependent protease with chaperone function
MQKIASGPVLSLFLALAVGIVFHLTYPSVPIDGGLAAVFALVGILAYLAATAILGLFSRTREEKTKEDRAAE